MKLVDVDIDFWSIYVDFDVNRPKIDIDIDKFHISHFWPLTENVNIPQFVLLSAIDIEMSNSTSNCRFRRVEIDMSTSISTPIDKNIDIDIDIRSLLVAFVAAPGGIFTFLVKGHKCEM